MTDSQPSTVEPPVKPTPSTTTGEGGFKTTTTSLEGLRDCYSGVLENKDSRDYVPEVFPASVPEGVRAVPVGGLGADIAVKESDLWVTVATAGMPDHRELVRIDLVSNEIAQSMSLDDLGRIAVEETVWITQFWQSSIIGVDPETLEQTTNVHLPPLPPSFIGEDDRCNRPQNLSLGEGALWVYARGTIVRVDPEDTEALVMIVPPEPSLLSKGSGIATGHGYVWLAGNGRELLRIDPATNLWLDGIPILETSGHWVADVVVTGDHVWVIGSDEADPNQDSPGGGISMIDPIHGEVIGTWLFTSDNLLLAAGGNSTIAVWENGVGLWLVDDTGQRSASPVICSETDVLDMTLSGDTVWVATSSGEVWQIDLRTTSAGC